MHKVIQKGLVFLLFLVPLIFSHATTEVYGLIKVVVLEIGVLALLVLWLVGITEASQIKVGRPGWAILAFFCVAVLSLIKATNIYDGLKSIYFFGAGVGLFFLIINNLKEEKEVNEILVALVLAAVLACFYSLYENRGIRFDISRFAYTSTFGNPVFFSQYLTFVIPISVAMCLKRKEALHLRVFFGLSSLFMLVFVVLTRSRGAYLGLALAILYCCVVLWSSGSKKLRKVFIATLAVCFIILTVGLMFLAQPRGWVGENIRFRNLIRFYLWSSTFQMAKDNPILGVGAGNFEVIYPLYRSPKERETTPKGVKYSQAHNDYLQIWAEMGTVGLICFLGILFSLAPFILHPLAERNGPASHISLGLCAGIITLLVQASFNPLLSIPSSGMSLWILLGLIALTGEKK